MNRAFPSLTALLGLVAVAGYQNRDKLAEMLKNYTSGGGDAAPPATPQAQPAQAGQPGQPDVLGGLLGSLTGGAAGSGTGGGGAGGLGGLLGNLGGAGLGGLLGGGLNDLVDQFKQRGQGEVAEFLDRHRPEQGGRPPPARGSGRPRRSRHSGSADRPQPRRAAEAAEPGPAPGRRPAHPAGKAALARCLESHVRLAGPLQRRAAH